MCWCINVLKYDAINTVMAAVSESCEFRQMFKHVWCIVGPFPFQTLNQLPARVATSLLPASHPPTCMCLQAMLQELLMFALPWAFITAGDHPNSELSVHNSS